MPNVKMVLFLIFPLFACQEKENDTDEFEDCPAIVLACPEGQIPCTIETDNDPCAEVVLGEEPCTQTRYCMPE